MTTPPGTSDFRLGPIMKELGAYIGGDESTAYFEHGELRLEPGGPEAPKLLSWYEPVWDGQLADELEAAGLLISTPPLSLSGSSFPEAGGFGWRMVEAEGVYVIDRRGWHRVMAAAHRRTRQPKTAADRALILAARALVHLAPDTPATVEEVQVIAGARDSAVRAARPSDGSETGRRKNRAVGPWLENLGMRTAPSSPKSPDDEEPRIPEAGEFPTVPPTTRGHRRGRQQTRVRPLGGPRKAEKE